MTSEASTIQSREQVYVITTIFATVIILNCIQILCVIKLLSPSIATPVPRYETSITTWGALEYHNSFIECCPELSVVIGEAAYLRLLSAHTIRDVFPVPRVNVQLLILLHLCILYIFFFYNFFLAFRVYRPRLVTWVVSSQHREDRESGER